MLPRRRPRYFREGRLRAILLFLLLTLAIQRWRSMIRYLGTAPGMPADFVFFTVMVFFRFRLSPHLGFIIFLFLLNPTTITTSSVQIHYPRRNKAIRTRANDELILSR